MHPSIARYGSLDHLPKVINLRAGKLRMIYESGFLRYIRIGDLEILRMINHLIRDKNWGNIPMAILSEDVRTDEDGFRINYRAECVQDDVQFEWTCIIEGKKDSTITFSISGVARHSFLRNRLGFTVLHPVETTVGKECTVTHGNGTTEVIHFPELISPHQPCIDIKSMQWSLDGGIEASLQFEGDLFEIEDQRNWLDATFKTYCTPLTLPHPHLVNAGDKVDQVVHFSASGGNDEIRPHKEVSFTLDRDRIYKLPKIGIPMSVLEHGEAIRSYIQELHADFIRVGLREPVTDWKDTLDKALQFNMPLEVVLFLGKENNADWKSLLIPYGKRIVQFIVLPAVGKSADQVLLDKVVPILRLTFPQAKIGSGTDIFFTELNRERTPSDRIDFLSFPVNPQAHAPDQRTMTENMVTHSDVVESCKAFSPKDVHVGPVTLKTRSSDSSQSNDKAMPPDVDPRILSVYAAAWTLGSIKYLTQGGASAVSYFETSGWKGLVAHPGNPWPSSFQASEVVVHPVYIILKEILKRKNDSVVELISDSPLELDGMMLVSRSGEETLMIANYTDQTVQCQIPAGIKASFYRVLSAETIAVMLKSPNENFLEEHAISEVIPIPAFSIIISA